MAEIELKAIDQKLVEDRTSKNILSMVESDWARIKECILFKNWSDDTFKSFMDEKRIFLKRFK